MNMIIAECPLCGCKRYSWDREDALNKLAKHLCSALDKELANRINIIDWINLPEENSRSILMEKMLNEIIKGGK